MSVTKEQVHAALRTVQAIAEAIRELKSVPSGHLYARLMGHMSLETYQKCVDMLVQAKLVESKNHLLTWIGPELS